MTKVVPDVFGIIPNFSFLSRLNPKRGDLEKKTKTEIRRF